MLTVLLYLTIAMFLAFCLADYFVFAKSDKRLLPNQWLLHLGLFVAGELLVLLLPFSAIIAAGFATSHGLGLMSWWPVSPVLGFVVWALAASFSEYLLHVASHRYQVLWAFHRVHHSDETMDASTGFRHHPLEAVISIAVLSSLALLLAPTTEIILLWYAISIAMEFFIHSRIHLPDAVSDVVEKAIITPRSHRVHHSNYAPQTDSNYGGNLSIWDRMFGTYRTDQPEVLGLDDPFISGKNSRDFDTLVIEPFAYLWRKWRRRDQPSPPQSP